MSDLALHDTHARLAHTQERFDALAQVGGRAMPKYLKRERMVPVSIAVSVLASAAEAKWGTKAAIGNALISATGYIIGFLAGDNADLREGAFTITTGLGVSAAAITTYDKMTAAMAAAPATAPAALPAGAPAQQ